MTDGKKCKACGTTKRKGQWWGLNNYYGLHGWFCPDCYDKVSHDSYGKPNNPAEYSFLLLKLGSQNENYGRTI